MVKLKGGIEQIDSEGYSITIDVMKKLKSANPKGYQSVCYEIGEAYLYYYNIGVKKDIYAAAATWFQYAKEAFPVAGMYCDISECLSNIAKFSKAEQYANLYKEYQNLWNQVKILQNSASNYEDDLKLRIWNEIIYMIQNNTKEFCEVSSQEEIIKILDSIAENSRKITNTFLQKNIETMQMNIEAVNVKIQSVKGENMN